MKIYYGQKTWDQHKWTTPQSILGQQQFDKVVSGDQEKKMKEILNLLLLLLRFKFRFDISLVEPSHIKGGDYHIQLG